MGPTPSLLGRFFLAVALLLAAHEGQAQTDCLGVDGGPALPGTPCDDGDPDTGTDEWNTYCVCVGYCDSWGMGGAPYSVPGMTCDDGNPNTVNDILDGNCLCGGCWFIGGAPGTPCDDGDPLTVNDVIGALGYCQGSINHLSGQVFLDLDGDGLFNGADLPIANRVVQAAPGQNYAVTDASGNFFIQPAAPGFYTLTPASGTLDVPSQVFPAIDLTVPGTGSTGNGLAMDPVSLDMDLSVRVMAGPPRPGFINYVNVIGKNEGVLPTSGTMTFTFDAQQTLVEQWPVGAVAGNTITWTLPTLQPGEVYDTYVQVRTGQAVPLGTVLAYTSTVATTPADAVPANDTYAAGPTVVGSFDPNAMQVEPATLTMADLAAGRPVTYTVRFQNTGTFAAENVRIADALPSGLKQSSFEFVASSHPCQAQIANGLLQFRFDGIMLPDSTSDEPNSHGWIIFRMRPQPFLTPGASVTNSAGIYFDLNDPVNTWATFAIDLVTGVPRSGTSQVKVWPNPARDRVNVAVPGRGPTGIEVSLIDVNGRTVLEATGRGDGFSIPVSGLRDGLYTLRIGKGRTALHARFVKGD